MAEEKNDKGKKPLISLFEFDKQNRKQSDEVHKVLSQLNFKNINDEKDELYKNTKKKYECIDIFKYAENMNNNNDQKALYEVLVAGQKNNTPQLLSLFVSDFSRARIKQFCKKNRKNDKNKNKSDDKKIKLSPVTWAEKSKAVDQIYRAPINSGVHNLRVTIGSAVATFTKRICPSMKFELQPEEKINDQLGFFATYIFHGIELIKNENWKPPCQVLFVYIYKYLSKLYITIKYVVYCVTI